MLSVVTKPIILSVNMLSVIMLNVVMLSVVAPFKLSIRVIRRRQKFHSHMKTTLMKTHLT